MFLRILAQEPEESHIFLGFDSYAENANKKKSALKWINGMDQLNSKKKTWAIPTINKSSRSRNGLTREYWEKQRLESSDTLIKYILFCEVKINRENLHCKKEKKKKKVKSKNHVRKAITFYWSKELCLDACVDFIFIQIILRYTCKSATFRGTTNTTVLGLYMKCSD